MAVTRHRAWPRWLNWSEQPITWTRDNHPLVVDNPGALALVVSPQVGGYTLDKVLMDGGNNINILYYETFLRMGLTQKQLQQSHTVFHGIVPGKSARPIGKIYLESAFGNAENFRSEIIPFEVVDLESPYHAILGRPAYARFMARPCDVYLKLKMSGPYGPITVEGSRARAMECDQQHVKIAESMCAKEDLSAYKEKVDPTESTILKKPTPDNNPKFQPAEDTKKVDFVPRDSTQQFIIGAGLSDK